MPGRRADERVMADDPHSEADPGYGDRHEQVVRSLEETARVFASIAETARRSGDAPRAERMERLAREAAERLERARGHPAGPGAPGGALPGARAPRTARVLLVDDHELAREALRAVLGRESDLVVVGEAADGDEALAQARRLQPDLVLMDVRMPGVDGLAATRAIRAELPSARVLLLTTYDTPGYVLEGLRAGADGYLLKGAAKQELLAVIRAVLRGEQVVQPTLATEMLRREAVDGRPAGDEGGLTVRERDVLRLLAAGQTNPEIAAELQVSLNTVKTHVVHILAKLGAADRTQAAVRAAQLGLLNDLLAPARD